MRTARRHHSLVRQPQCNSRSASSLYAQCRGSRLKSDQVAPCPQNPPGPSTPYHRTTRAGYQIDGGKNHKARTPCGHLHLPCSCRCNVSYTPYIPWHLWRGSHDVPSGALSHARTTHHPCINMSGRHSTSTSHICATCGSATSRSTPSWYTAIPFCS